jgi:uncharacterized protein
MADKIVGDVDGNVKINDAGGDIINAENDIVTGDKIEVHQYYGDEKEPRRFRWMVYVVTVVLISLLGIFVYTQFTTSPNEARVKIKQMGMDFDAKTFIEHAGNNDTQAVELFLEAGMNPNEEENINPDDSNKVSAIEMAAANGHLDIVKKLVEHGANLEKAMYSAAANNQKAVLDFTLASNPSLLAINKALIGATSSDDTSILQLLLDKGADMNFVDKDFSYYPFEGATALIMSALHGKIENMRILLSKNADVNIGGNDTVPSALFASFEFIHSPSICADMVNLLLEHGADINVKNKDNKTPLLAAITSPNIGDEQERLNIVKSLLNKDSDLTVRDKSMESWQPTPLLAAIHGEKSEIALLLIEQGADVNEQSGAIDGNGSIQYNALMQASEKGLVNVVDALLSKGAEINTRNENGDSALLIAAANHNIDKIVPMLLDKGADATVANNDGITVLMNAATSSGYVSGDTIELLIKQGINVNATDKRGWTALMYAADARYDSSEVIKTLLGHSANINVTNNEGNNALSIATQAEHKAVVKLLNEYPKK